MTRWDYRVAALESGLLKWKWDDGDFKGQSLESGLSFLGSQGWELVATVPETTIGSTSKISFIFKRARD